MALGAALALLLCRACHGKDVEYVERERVVRDTMHHYPGPMPLPRPEQVVFTRYVKVEDQAARDSLIAFYTQLMLDCEASYVNVLAGLRDTQSKVAEAPLQMTVSESRDSFGTEDYSLRWEIGVLGELLYFRPDVTVRHPPVPVRKNASVGLHVGVRSDLGGSMDFPVGLDYDAGSWGVGASLFPRSGGGMLTLRGKFLKFGAK